MVERSIAWLTRGARRVPYRGVEKNNNWLHHRAAGLNLRRLLAMGLTVENGTWDPGLKGPPGILHKQPSTHKMASGGRNDPVVAPRVLT